MQRPTPKTTEQPGDSVKLTLVIERSEKGAHAPDPASASADLVIELPEGSSDAPDPASASADLVIELPEGSSDAPDPALAGAGAPRPLSRPPMRLTIGRWAAGVAALAVLAILGYEVYRNYSSLDLPIEKLPLSTAGSSGATERRGPGASGNIGRDTAAGDGTVAKINQGVAPLAASVSPLEAVPADAVPAPPKPPRASRPASAALTVSKRKSPRAEPCTAAIAAIGLCSLQPGPAAQAETAGTGNGHPQDSVARKAVKRAQPPAVPCTVGVAALGLCAAESIQGKE